MMTLSNIILKIQLQLLVLKLH